jgi:hypothetical protein
MGDEDGVIMVKLAVAHGRPGHMGHGIIGPVSSITASLRVSTPLAVRVKDLNSGPRPEAGKDMRHRRRSWSRPCMRMWWKLRAIGDVDLQHLGERAAPGRFPAGSGSAPASSLTQWCRIASEVSDSWT